MTDDKPRPDDETQPVRPEGAAALPPAPEPAAAAPAATTADPVPAGPAAGTAGRRGFRERLRSRTFGLAALIASALAGIIVGGLGLAAVQAIGDDRGRDRTGWMQQRDADRGVPGRGGMHNGPRGVPGQLSPTTPPEDEDSSSS